MLQRVPGRKASNVVRLASYKAARFPTDADWLNFFRDMGEEGRNEVSRRAEEIIERRKRAIGDGALVLDMAKRRVREPVF